MYFCGFFPFPNSSLLRHERQYQGCIQNTKTLFSYSNHYISRTDETLRGIDIEYVDSWTHIGHILSSDFRDNMDIEHRRVQTVKQINDMLAYFGK